MIARGWWRWGAVAALSLLLACGRGSIFLTIEGVGPEGTLRIPDDVDKVAVSVTTADGSASLLEKEYPLTAEQKFPLTLGLEPGPKTGTQVRVAVSAWKAEQPVGDAEAVVPITAQEVASVTLRIVKP